MIPVGKGLFNTGGNAVNIFLTDNYFLVADGADGIYFLKNDLLTGNIFTHRLQTEELILEKSFPNPFEESTCICFSLLKTNNINIQIFDLFGREIITLTDEVYNAGSYEINWDGKDFHGKKVSYGIYFLKIATGSGYITDKLIFNSQNR